MARSWIAVGVVLVVACGHSAPETREQKSAGSAAASASTGSAEVSPEATPHASDAATVQSGPEIGNGHGDERHDIRPIDARIIGITPSGAKLLIGIGLPLEVEPGTVTVDWTGTFTKDGKVIDGSDFKLDDAHGRTVRAQIVATQVPSERVRLFPPGYVR